MLQAQQQPIALPTTFDEFLRFEPTDGIKYEWNARELIRTGGMKRKHLKLIKILSRLFAATTACQSGGELVCEQDVMLTGIQMRRPDVAYFSDAQIRNEEDEPIPAFCIEIISPTDESEKVENKRIEYFKAGVLVLWPIFPENRKVYSYTSRKMVQICYDDDICSSQLVLNDFTVSVNELLNQSGLSQSEQGDYGSGIASRTGYRAAGWNYISSVIRPQFCRSASVHKSGKKLRC